MRVFHEVEELTLREAGVRDDQLVDCALGEHARDGFERAEHRQCRLGLVGRDRAEEFVLDAASGRSDRAEQVLQSLSLAHEHGTSPDAGEPEYTPRMTPPTSIATSVPTLSTLRAIPTRERRERM